MPREVCRIIATVAHRFPAGHEGSQHQHYPRTARAKFAGPNFDCVLTVCDNTKESRRSERLWACITASNVPAEVKGTDEKRPGAFANLPG